MAVAEQSFTPAKFTMSLVKATKLFTGQTYIALSSLKGNGVPLYLSPYGRSARSPVPAIMVVGSWMVVHFKQSAERGCGPTLLFCNLEHVGSVKTTYF